MTNLIAQIPHVGYKIIGPGLNPINAVDATSKMELTISRIVGVMTIVGVIYFAIQIILAGYAYISSQGDSKKAEETKKRLTDGIIGIFLVAVSLGFAALFAKLLGLESVFDLNTMFSKLGL